MKLYAPLNGCFDRVCEYTVYIFNRFIHTAIFNSSYKNVQKIMTMIKRMALITFYAKEKTENTVNMITSVRNLG